MKRFTIPLFLAALWTPTSVQAQFFAGSSAYSSSGFGFSYSSKKFSVYGGYSQRIAYGYGFAAYPVYGNSFGPCGFSYCPPPIVTFVQPVYVVRPVPVYLPPIEPVNFEEPISKKINLDEFIVIRPRGNGKPIDGIEVPEKLPILAKAVDLGVPPAELALNPKAEVDPKAEFNRQLQLGREVFEFAQFGRAKDRFKQAIRVAPLNPTGYFYLAQADFAGGKYDEAVASILRGLQLRPDWPSSRFEPRGFFGNNLGLYDVLLQELKNTIDARPDDPRLLFLYGYQLWFDGRREEAKKWLNKAAERSLDPEPILLFAEGGRVVRR